MSKKKAKKEQREKIALDKDWPPIDRYGIKPRPHTPIKNKRKLREFEALFDRIVTESRQESR